MPVGTLEPFLWTSWDMIYFVKKKSAQILATERDDCLVEGANEKLK